MTEPNAQALQEELEHYRCERDKIRAIVGQIGGKATAKREKMLNIVFVVLVLFLFGFGLAQDIGWLHRLLPSVVSLELAVLLVSIKIIWMIHRQTRVEHFQFWILNSIEFRLTEMSRRMRELHEELDRSAGAAG